jgi:hypothetical protein
MSQSQFCDGFLLIYDKIYPSWIKGILVVWASVIGVLLPLHATGVLWALAAAPIAALPHSGGNLYPLL